MEFLKCRYVLWKGPEKRNEPDIVATTGKHPDSRSQISRYGNLVPRVFVPLDQRSENESSGSNHFEITDCRNNRILVIMPIRFHCAVCIYGACLKWLLPELSFSDHWSRGTKTLGTRLRYGWMQPTYMRNVSFWGTFTRRISASRSDLL